MTEFYGGDRVRTDTGREGVITSTAFSLRGGETTYTLDRDEQWAPASEGGHRINAWTAGQLTLIEHGRHEYRPGGPRRGTCGRCGVSKRDHAS